MANEFDSYDRDMYELAEAEAKLDLALKQIESKYYIKHIIMESSGEFTPEEIIAMEAEDAENEAKDKRGAIRRFIDTIIKKIQVRVGDCQFLIVKISQRVKLKFYQKPVIRSI